ncbi:MAG: hypothetical protein HKUEN02_15080 [Anaerolineaceae bacterium]|nr:MAG: hypothetical protein HKUEN02_15080 [Anaerolineaceae bacterium]
MSLLNIVRWFHVISGISWLGEVITINFVLVPVVLKLSNKEREAFIQNVFPRIFRLASVLSGTAIISGALLNYLLTGWKNLDVLLHSRWGMSIAIGGAIGLLLALFHFTFERHLEPIAVSVDEMSDEEVQKMLNHLKVVPRVGMLILIAVILLMMIAIRGV